MKNKGLQIRFLKTSNEQSFYKIPANCVVENNTHIWFIKENVNLRRENQIESAKALAEDFIYNFMKNRDIYKSIRKQIPPPSIEHKPKKGVYSRKNRYNRLDPDE